MQTFNVLSLFVFFGIFSTLGGVVAILNFRHLDRSAQYWAVATLMTGLTVLLTVFRESLPPVLSYSTAIGLNVWCYVVMGRGVALLGEKEDQHPHFMSRLAGLTLAFITVLELTRRYLGVEAALVVTSLGFGSAGIWSSAQAQAHFARTGFVFALWLRWALFGLGVVQFIRIQGAFTGMATTAFVQDSINQAVYSAVFVLGLLRYVFYVAMRLQEKVQVANQAAQLVEKTALELASSNAFIASALREAPVACLVTNANNDVLVGNKEAERLLGKKLPSFGEMRPTPLRLGELFMGLSASQDWVAEQPKTFFSRSHAGDARCLTVRGQVFPDAKDNPQQVFTLHAVVPTADQAGEWLRAERLEAGSTLLLAQADGQVLAASAGWRDVQRHCDGGPSCDLWQTLAALPVSDSAGTVLGKATASKSGGLKALALARKRVTQEGHSSSMFVRLADGSSCDVLFDPLVLSGQADKTLLVEIRLRPGLVPQSAPKTITALARAV